MSGTSALLYSHIRRGCAWNSQSRLSLAMPEKRYTALSCALSVQTTHTGTMPFSGVDCAVRRATPCGAVA